MVQETAGTTAQSTRQLPGRPDSAVVSGGVGHEPPVSGTSAFCEEHPIPDSQVFMGEPFGPDAPDHSKVRVGEAIADEELFEERSFDEQAFDDMFFDQSLHDFLEGDPLTLARTLTELSPAAINELSPERAVEMLGAAVRLESWVAALKARVIHRLEKSLAIGADTAHRKQLAAMNAVSETACALRVPEGVAGYLVNESAALVECFPSTLSALEEGRVHYQHAQVILREGAGLPSCGRPGFEEELLLAAPDLTRTQLATRARRLREHVHPEAQAGRRRKAELDRRVYVEPAADGMAYLGAFLPAESALALFNHVSAVSLSLQGAEELRTLGQLRADVLTDLVLGCGMPKGKGNGHPRGVKAQVLVTVPVLSLLGDSDAPADLEGYGPIPAAVARQLAAHTPSWIRLLTDPADGAVLSVGRRRYRVPKDLRTYLRASDGTCRFPGCNCSAGHADLDHTVSWEDGGPTGHDNLAALCRLCRYRHNAADTTA